MAGQLTTAVSLLLTNNSKVLSMSLLMRLLKAIEYEGSKDKNIYYYYFSSIVSVSQSALIPGTNMALKWPCTGHFEAVVPAGTCLLSVIELYKWAIFPTLHTMVICSFPWWPLWQWHSHANKSQLLLSLVSQATAHFLLSPPYSN